jgi:hypothetical protein
MMNGAAKIECPTAYPVSITPNVQASGLSSRSGNCEPTAMAIVSWAEGAVRESTFLVSEYRTYANARCSHGHIYETSIGK